MWTLKRHGSVSRRGCKKWNGQPTNQVPGEKREQTTRFDQAIRVFCSRTSRRVNASWKINEPCRAVIGAKRKKKKREWERAGRVQEGWKEEEIGEKKWRVGRRLLAIVRTPLQRGQFHGELIRFRLRDHRKLAHRAVGGGDKLTNVNGRASERNDETAAARNFFPDPYNQRTNRTRRVAHWGRIVFPSPLIIG